MDCAKLITLYDFHQIPIPEKLLVITIKEAELEEKRQELGVRFSTIEGTKEPIQEKDIIVITLPEEVDKPNSEADYRSAAQVVPGRVQINVGKGVYDPQWEAELIGKTIGDQVTLPRRGHNKEGVITEIKRRNCPEITDALAARLGLDGVSTLEGYRQYWAKRIEEREKHKKLSGLVGFICKELRQHSTFTGLPEDSKEAAEIQMKLMADAMAEQAGVTFDQNSYEALLKGYVDAGMKRDDLLAQVPYEIYLQQAPLMNMNECIAAYYNDKFKVVTV